MLTALIQLIAELDLCKLFKNLQGGFDKDFLRYLEKKSRYIKLNREQVVCFREKIHKN